MMQLASRIAFAVVVALFLQACSKDTYEPLSPTEPQTSKDAQYAGSGIETAGGGTPTTLHVSVSGSDAALGTAARPLRSLKKAIDKAGAGTTILLHGGTYNGQIETTKSGTATKPITVTSAGDGPVTLTAILQSVPCTAREPARDRTIRLLNGADYWIFKNLSVVGGIQISGSKTGDNLKTQLGNRSLPGRGSYNPTGARTTLERLGSNPAVGNQFLYLKITRRGIFGAAARAGKIEDNKISNIDCATGGGVWLGRFSDEWSVKRNHVYDLKESVEHFMSEGIRFSGASDYNIVEANTVEDIKGKGRGITTDVFSSFNTFRGNRVRRTAIGYSEQQGGWGNKWLDNTSEYSSRNGYAVFLMGNKTNPADEDTPSGIEFRGNRSIGDAVAMQMGGIKKSSFASNNFPKVSISPLLRSYWKNQGNSWNGTPNPPPGE